MKEQACSVLLPLYNGSKFINGSIKSILESMREIDELVLVNDGSEDISKEELREIEKRDSRIKIINKNHSGLVETLNYGIRHCENDLIARADIDDKYSSKRISRQVQFMATNPNCAAVFSDYQILSADGRDLGTIPTSISPRLTRFSLLNPQRTPHPSVMFRKTAVTGLGGYRSEDFPAEDLSLWINLSKSFKIATIPETLLFYTIHKANITSKHQEQMIKKTRFLLEEFVKTLSIDAILDEAEETFEVYNLTTQTISRKILFFRDLSKYLKMSQAVGVRKLTKHTGLFRQIIQPNSILSIIQLKEMQKRRKSL
jgi:glycosyltransferase involved in cell wall biosynthesis